MCNFLIAWPLRAKGGVVWVDQFLFAKKDRDNIDDDELVALKELARAYEQLASNKLDELMGAKELLEICFLEHKEQSLSMEHLLVLTL